MRNSNKAKILTGLLGCILLGGIWFELHYHRHCCECSHVAVVGGNDKAYWDHKEDKVITDRHYVNTIKVPKIKSEEEPNLHEDSKIISIHEPSTILLLIIAFVCILINNSRKRK